MLEKERARQTDRQRERNKERERDDKEVEKKMRHGLVLIYLSYLINRFSHSLIHTLSLCDALTLFLLL